MARDLGNLLKTSTCKLPTFLQSADIFFRTVLPTETLMSVLHEALVDLRCSEVQEGSSHLRL